MAATCGHFPKTIIELGVTDMTEIEQILPHIATIHDLTGESLAVSDAAPHKMNLSDWTIRLAARCILVDPSSGRIALQSLDSEGVSKIPGGGLQYTLTESDGESFMSGVVREIAEEVGVDATSIKLKPLGLTLEYRSDWKLIQISYCYTGDIDDTRLGEPLEDGSHLVWADTPAHALKLVNSYKADTYDKSFMQRRDNALIEHYIKFAYAQ